MKNYPLYIAMAVFGFVISELMLYLLTKSEVYPISPAFLTFNQAFAFVLGIGFVIYGAIGIITKK